jgi:transposase-like protein
MRRRQEQPVRLATRRWREAEGRAMVDAWRRSGESLAAFARRRGVQEQRLRYWIDRLSVPASATPLRFHPVRLLEGPPSPPRTGDWTDDRIEILLRDGRTVRVPAGVAVDDLRQVLAVLEPGR